MARLSRAPRERPRPRDRATPTPHGTRCYRRKNGPQRQPRFAASVQRSCPRSPIRRGIVKTGKTQHDAGTQPLHERPHLLLLYALLRCSTWRVVGWVDRWVGFFTCCFCCSTAVHPTPNSTCEERRNDLSPRGNVNTSSSLGSLLLLRSTGDNGNAMFPSKVRISKIPTKRFLYRSL